MLLLTACGSKGTDLEASKFWARSALKDGNSAAYMLLSNNTATDDELIGVSCDAAMAAEIHLSQVDTNGVMQMTPQESVPLPAGGELELRPGSYHIMLIGIKQDFKTGENITLTLHFKNHADITLTVPVQEAENMGGAGMDGHMP
jgi:copper(I)-binding protein